MWLPKAFFAAAMRAYIDRWLDRMVARMDRAYLARGVPERVVTKDESKVRMPRQGSTNWMTRRRR